jgi:hypothetical protein
MSDEPDPFAGMCVSCLIYNDGECDECAEKRRLLHALRTLAANIVIGAALCRADELGYRRCTETNNPDAWRPGCQRPALGRRRVMKPAMEAHAARVTRDKLTAWASDWRYIVMNGRHGLMPHGNLHSITLFKLLRNAKKACKAWGESGIILEFVPSLLPAVLDDDIVAGDDVDEYQFAERMATLWAQRAAALSRYAAGPIARAREVGKGE